MLLYGQYDEKTKIQIQNPGKLYYNDTMDSKSQSRKVFKLLQIKLIMGGKKRKEGRKRNQGSG